MIKIHTSHWTKSFGSRYIRHVELLQLLQLLQCSLVYHKSVIFYRKISGPSILPNHSARNVPQNVVQTNYVPQVPHMWYSCGTKTSSPLDGDKFTDFWVDLMKILFFGKI